MSKGRRAPISLRWAFGTIIIVFILLATSMTHSAEVDDVRAAISVRVPPGLLRKTQSQGSPKKK